MEDAEARKTLFNALYVIANIIGILLLASSLLGFSCLFFSDTGTERSQCGMATASVLIYGLIIQSVSVLISIIIRKHLNKRIKYIIWLVIPSYITIILIMSLFAKST